MGRIRIEVPENVLKDWERRKNNHERIEDIHQAYPQYSVGKIHKELTAYMPKNPNNNGIEAPRDLPIIQAPTSHTVFPRFFQGAMKPAPPAQVFIRVEGPQLLPVFVKSPTKPQDPTPPTQPLYDAFRSAFATKIFQTLTQLTQPDSTETDLKKVAQVTDQPTQPNPAETEWKQKMYQMAEQRRQDEKHRTEEAFWRNIEERKRADQASRAQEEKEMMKLREDDRVKDQTRTDQIKEAIVTFVRDTNANQNRVLDSCKQGMQRQFQRWEPMIDSKAFEKDREQDELLRREFEEVEGKIDARAQEQNAAARKSPSPAEQFYLEQTQRLAEARRKRQTIENVCAVVGVGALIAKEVLDVCIRRQANKQSR